MAKNNNNNNKPKNNYFTNMTQRYNDKDFIKYRSSRELETDAQMIFKQLASSRININEYGRYFLYVNLMDACIKVAKENLMIHYLSMDALNFKIQAMSNAGIRLDTNLSMIREYHRRKYEAYNIIAYGLEQVKISADPNYLYTLVNNLSGYKNDL